MTSVTVIMRANERVEFEATRWDASEEAFLTVFRADDTAIATFPPGGWVGVFLTDTGEAAGQP